MTCRNSASLRVRQSSGRVALYLMVWTLRSRTAESYANAGVRPVAITTPELSFVGIGYRHGGRHLLSLRFHPLLLPSLSLRGTIAAQVLTCCHNDTRASCVSVGYRHGGRHLLLRIPSFTPSKLGTAWHNRYAGGALIRTDTRVCDIGYRHGRLTCYA